MFAAGNNAKEAMLALMDAGGQQALSLQDNRGNNVLKYALDDSEVKLLLEKRCDSSYLPFACFNVSSSHVPFCASITIGTL